MKTITTLISAIVSLAESWLPNTNLQNDVEDGILALTEISTLTSNPIAGAALAIVNKTEAGLTNLASGQAATVATRTVDGETYSLVLVKNGTVAATAIGL